MRLHESVCCVRMSGELFSFVFFKIVLLQGTGVVDMDRGPWMGATSQSRREGNSIFICV
jgi:hypothetical protein